MRQPPHARPGAGRPRPQRTRATWVAERSARAALAPSSAVWNPAQRGAVRPTSAQARARCQRARCQRPRQPVATCWRGARTSVRVQAMRARPVTGDDVAAGALVAGASRRGSGVALVGWHRWSRSRATVGACPFGARSVRVLETSGRCVRPPPYRPGARYDYQGSMSVGEQRYADALDELRRFRPATFTQTGGMCAALQAQSWGRQ